MFQSKGVQIPWTVLTSTAITLLAILVGGIFLLRKVVQNSPGRKAENLDAAPRTENASAFMAASMQAVIKKLKEQEKELERLQAEIERRNAERAES